MGGLSVVTAVGGFLTKDYHTVARALLAALDWIQARKFPPDLDACGEAGNRLAALNREAGEVDDA